MKKLISMLALAATLATPASAEDRTLLTSNGLWEVWVSDLANGEMLCTLESVNDAGQLFTTGMASNGTMGGVLIFPTQQQLKVSQYDLEFEVDDQGAWFVVADVDFSQGMMSLSFNFGALEDYDLFLSEIVEGSYVYIQRNSETPNESVVTSWSLDGSADAVEDFVDCVSRIMPRQGDPA